ncbi:GNAT family N-acetyltransferase [Nocardioides taihuensis]|uniref:GNAT family N-acetyltransferase n=1 Tax=Nocardioides taihuensis TaxID=1835606 RepID=A0ABW0BF92_9ACTN
MPTPVRATTRVVDPSDEGLLRAWWEVGRAATADRPLDSWPVWEVSRVALPQARTDLRLDLLVAEVDGEVVGAAMLVLFRMDNTHLGEVDVWVHPDHRRRGTGSALLAACEDRARADGRDTLISSVYAPMEADSLGSGFAARHGYVLASGELVKALDLPASAPGWGPLDDEVAAVIDGYRVEVWEDRTPDVRVDDFCALLDRLLGEIPLGELDLRPARWDEARLREGEERAAAAGRLQVVAAAVAPDGHLCGFTDLRLHRPDPRHASVGATMVLPEHRGHRLGLAVKLASHRRLLELEPGCHWVETSNAGMNAPMNAVNQKLGYRSVERCLDVQKRI